jgi:hypothetical protein
LFRSKGGSQVMGAMGPVFNAIATFPFTDGISGESVLTNPIMK